MAAQGKLRLGVNIDHVATVRNARGGAYPDPLRAARAAQEAGRHRLFADYRLRIAHVIRDYGMNARDQAPEDSRAANG